MWDIIENEGPMPSSAIRVAMILELDKDQDSDFQMSEESEFSKAWIHETSQP